MNETEFNRTINQATPRLFSFLSFLFFFESRMSLAECLESIIGYLKAAHKRSLFSDSEHHIDITFQMDTFSTTMISSPKVRAAVFPGPQYSYLRETFQVHNLPAPLDLFLLLAPHSICLAHPSMT